jgi:glycosyltransferase involved in cell wall biosynthesis
MRALSILVLCRRYHPKVGGIETVTRLLCVHWKQLGHHVTVATQDASSGSWIDGIRIVRAPGPVHLALLVNAAEVIHQHNPSLKTSWPMLLLRKQWILTHHDWFISRWGATGWRHALRGLLLRFPLNTAVSHAITAELPARTIVIHNLYNDRIFFNEDETRENRLLWLGRIDRCKGCYVLLDALEILRSRGISPLVSFIGDGEEIEPLKNQFMARGFYDQVTFHGVLEGDRLRSELCRHSVMVIPSTISETFGIVALEAMACGLKIVASDIGGLRESVGCHGRLFEPGSPQALANALDKALGDYAPDQPVSPSERQHLDSHTVGNIAGQYSSLWSSEPGRLV